MSETSGEYSPGYRVNFYSGGDTTREAFGRLIQEVERIYGILNALNHGKVDYSGIINASKVGGLLTGATIDSDHVVGLGSKLQSVKSEIQNGLSNFSSSNGIRASSLNEDGYVQIGSTLMFQWGIVSKSAVVNFPRQFPLQCLNITLTLEVPEMITLTETISNEGASSSTTPANDGVIVGQPVTPVTDGTTVTYPAGTTLKAPLFNVNIKPDTISRTGFKFWIKSEDALLGEIFFDYMKVHYFAVGV